MTSALYASILAILICYLALQVIKARRRHRVKYADGDIEELKIARSAHSNCAEYVPIGLILLFALEYNSDNIWLVHAIGILFTSGRIIHARNILKENLKGRVLGMKITFASIASLAVLNFIYLPFDKLLKLF